MVSDSTSFDENSETIRRSRAKYDKSLVLENSILNESLEKERFKRRVLVAFDFLIQWEGA